jgi:hypothetical protein
LRASPSPPGGSCDHLAPIQVLEGGEALVQAIPRQPCSPSATIGRRLVLTAAPQNPVILLWKSAFTA